MCQNIKVIFKIPVHFHIITGVDSVLNIVAMQKHLTEAVDDSFC